MHRPMILAAGGLFVVLAAALPAAPALAVTAKQKLATCKFGADDQHLLGPERAKFIRNCMSNKNDPRGRGAPAESEPPPEK